MHIVFYHLLNDFSGSPKVLKYTIQQALDEGHSVDLFSSAGGPLDDIRHPKFRHFKIPYSFHTSKFLTLCHFVWTQIIFFFSTFRYIFRKNTRFYINTILPVGAALGARTIGRNLTVHCHENATVKGPAYRSLSRTMLSLAHNIICVSKYQASFLPENLNIKIVPNSLTEDFISRLKPDPEAAFERKNILMLSSLKVYKGMREFLNLAAMLPAYTFTLVINDTQKAIDNWLKTNGITPTQNITIYSRQADVVPFYNSASIVLNLSNPRLFVESFGMTALEARAASLPVIVPPVGAIADIIKDGVDGFHIDCHDTPALSDTITLLLSDRSLYLRIARNSSEQG